VVSSFCSAMETPRVVVGCRAIFYEAWQKYSDELR